MQKVAKNHPVYEKARAARGESGRAWIDTKDCAALIRTALAKAFPGIKFSVRSDVYSGGSSIDVSWLDGPSQPQVEKVARRYAMGGFDGMIDLAYSVDLWLNPDGSVNVAHSQGTEGSRGSCPEILGDATDPRAVIIRGGADHVFCNRRLTNEDDKRERVGRLLCERQQIEFQGMSTRHLYGNGDRDTLMEHAWRILYVTDFRKGNLIAGLERYDGEFDPHCHEPFRLVLAVGADEPKPEQPKGPFWTAKNLLAINPQGWTREFRKMETVTAEAEKLRDAGFDVEIVRIGRSNSLYIRKLEGSAT